MENKKQYSKPQITDTVNLEAIAGTCTTTGGKQSGTCTLFINS